MTAFLKFAISKHPYLSLIFGVGFGALIYLTVDVVAETIYFNDPAHRRQALEPWMTPRYVAMSWELPRPVIEEIFQLGPREDGPPPRLSDISERLDVGLEDLQAQIQAASDAERARSRD